MLLSRTYELEVKKEDVDEYFNKIDEILTSTSGPYLFISLDEKENQYISGEMRIYLGKRSLKISEKYKDRNPGSIIISKGVIKKMMIKAISLVNKQFSDIIIVKSKEEAFEKAQSILLKNGIPWKSP